MTDPTPGLSRFRRMVRLARRLVIVLVAAFALLLATAAVVEAILEQRDERRFPPPGELYEVAGHQLHLQCVGEGSPTVLLDAGAQLWSSSWWWVQRELGAQMRVCAHDRSGLGWSELGDGPWDGVTAADELHELLDAAGVERPFVYVGHSLGTMLGQIYHDRYPGELSGLVFVDWRPPSALITEFEAVRDAPPTPCGLKCSAAPWAARFGLVRIMVGRLDALDDARLPLEAVAEFKSRVARADVVRASLDVARFVPTYLFQAEDTGNLGDLPLLVIYGEVTGTLFGVFDDEAEKTRWLEEELPAEQELATKLSTRSHGPVEIAGANHLSVIAFEEPAREVSRAIGKFVAELQEEGLAEPSDTAVLDQERASGRR